MLTLPVHAKLVISLATTAQIPLQQAVPTAETTWSSFLANANVLLALFSILQHTLAFLAILPVKPAQDLLKASAFHVLQASAFIKRPVCVLQRPITTLQWQAVLNVMVLARSALDQEVISVRRVMMENT